MLRLLALSLLAASLLLGGCAPPPTPAARNTPPAATATPPAFAPTQQPGQPCIESMVLRGGKWVPDRLVVKVNCAVLFTNRDDAPVQVQGPDFVLGEMAKDGAWARTFRDPGTFEIHNAKDPTQRATVIVQP